MPTPGQPALISKVLLITRHSINGCEIEHLKSAQDIYFHFRYVKSTDHDPWDWQLSTLVVWKMIVIEADLWTRNMQLVPSSSRDWTFKSWNYSWPRFLVLLIWQTSSPRTVVWHWFCYLKQFSDQHSVPWSHIWMNILFEAEHITRYYLSNVSVVAPSLEANATKDDRF